MMAGGMMGGMGGMMKNAGTPQSVTVPTPTPPPKEGGSIKAPTGAMGSADCRCVGGGCGEAALFRFVVLGLLEVA